MMNRIDQVIKQKGKDLVNIYFSAGYPSIESILPIMQLLEKNGASMIEVGMPFSDPLADGLIIQESSRQALANGLTLKGLFAELRDVRQHCQLPIILMGYLNPVMQYGFEPFLKEAAACGIDGLILPDLPPEIYESTYAQLYQYYNIYPIFLVTPQTTDGRLHYLDSLSKGFIYAVSSSSTTGKSTGFTMTQQNYFERLSNAGLRNPLMIGFGVSNHQNLQTVFQFAQGAVIGSAFIKSLIPEAPDYGISQFMNQLINEN